MRKMLAALIATFLLAAGVAFAATGDILAVRIAGDNVAESGWVAEIDIEGLAVGGTYDFGFTGTTPTAPKATFTVTSAGYDNTGAVTTMTRTVYGTNYQRKVYPDHASAKESVVGTTLTIRVALSDWIYDPDNVVVTLGAGLYTQGTASAAATNMAVTNNSQEAYPRVIANWSWPGYSRVTGDFKLRAVAFHRSARGGKPVQAVKFECADEHSHTVTVTETAAKIDNTATGDALPVIEYVGTIPVSSLTQGDQLTCNFTAYPIYGDNGSLVYTGDGVNTMPTPLYAPQTYRLDKTGAWGSTVAVVDSAVADDTGGEAIDSASFNPASPPGAYKNIYAAVNAIAAYNNTNHSRNNAGGGVVYLKEGTHVWTGGTVSAGGQANAGTWITVTKFPGATRENVIIGSASGTKQAGEHLKLNQIKITNSTTAGFTGMDAVWMDNCVLASTGAATFYVNSVTYMTGSTVGNVDEFKPYSTTNSPRALIRGITSTENIATRTFKPYVALGNRLPLISGSSEFVLDTIAATPFMSNLIVSGNYIGTTGTNAIITYSSPVDNNAKTHGLAIVQNVLERISGGATICQLAADGSGADNVNNVLLWHNTLVGQRINAAYNDCILNDDGPRYRRHWHFFGNAWDDYNCITDIDAHGKTPDDDRYGNHGVIHGVGSVANVNLNRAGTPDYNNKFYGLYSTNLDDAEPYYVSDNSVVGSGAGGGDYRLTSAESPLASIVPAGYAVLPYDLDGYPRKNDGTGAAGAYEYPQEAEGSDPEPPAAVTPKRFPSFLNFPSFPSR